MTTAAARKTGSMWIDRMMVTPTKALEWLALNKKNRPVKERRVAFYCKEMLAGRWRVNHQGIAFDPDGNLVDGQHRLMAIARAGVSVEMFVAHGVEDSTTVDKGAGRSVSDELNMYDGTQNARAVVAIINAMRFAEIGTNASALLSVGEAREFVTKWKEHFEWFFAEKSYHFRLFPAPIAAAFIIAHRFAPETTEVFMGRYSMGEGLSRGDPEFALRNYVTLNTSVGAGGTSGRISMTRRALQALAYKRDGKQLFAIKPYEKILQSWGPLGFADTQQETEHRAN